MKNLFKKSIWEEYFSSIAKLIEEKEYEKAKEILLSIEKECGYIPQKYIKEYEKLLYEINTSIYAKTTDDKFQTSLKTIINNLVISPTTINIILLLENFDKIIQPQELDKIIFLFSLPNISNDIKIQLIDAIIEKGKTWTSYFNNKIIFYNNELKKQIKIINLLLSYNNSQELLFMVRKKIQNVYINDINKQNYFIESLKKLYTLLFPIFGEYNCDECFTILNESTKGEKYD